MNYDNATGWLIGEENKGMQGMFVMMNEARLGVAVQGLAQSEVAYQNAVQYARERLQGRSLTGAKEPDKPAEAGKDTRIAGSGPYAVMPHPTDGSVWYTVNVFAGTPGFMRFDPKTKLCFGCGRTLPEIARWHAVVTGIGD